MKKMLLGALCAVMLSGCAAVMTPVGSTVPVDSSEIAKSSMLGENCMTWFLMFGPFGDASIKPVLDRNAGKKVTLIDYKYDAGFLTRSQCVQIYGR